MNYIRIILISILCFTALKAGAADPIPVSNANLTGMNDFELVFDKPPTVNLRQLNSGTPFAADPLNPNKYKASGFSVGAFGGDKGSNIIRIQGLGVVGINTNPNAARVLSWSWTKDGNLNDANGTPWIQPYLIQDSKELSLEQLDRLGLKVVAVPEPAEVFMLMAGLALIAMVRRHKAGK